MSFKIQITADTNKACSGDFGASSAAAAMASGLIALMLSAKWVLAYYYSDIWISVGWLLYTL